MNRIEQAQKLLAAIREKGRPCAVLISADGRPLVRPAIYANKRPSKILETASAAGTLIGVYTPECPVEWIAADLAAEGGALCAA